MLLRSWGKFLWIMRILSALAANKMGPEDLETLPRGPFTTSTTLQAEGIHQKPPKVYLEFYQGLCQIRSIYPHILHNDQGYVLQTENPCIPTAKVFGIGHPMLSKCVL